LITITFNETQIFIHTKHIEEFSNQNGLKGVNFSNHCFLSFILENSIKILKENENVLKLEAQFSFEYTADHVNLLAESINALKRKTKILLDEVGRLIYSQTKRRPSITLFSYLVTRMQVKISISRLIINYWKM
jgi:hypothetical protein